MNRRRGNQTGDLGKGSSLICHPVQWYGTSIHYYVSNNNGAKRNRTFILSCQKKND